MPSAGRQRIAFLVLAEKWAKRFAFAFQLPPSRFFSVRA
jgi:hypothetical protein